VFLSPVELAERSACHRALRETIGRQLRAEYDTSNPLPDQLLGLLHQLRQGEEKPFVLPAAPVKAKHALVGVIADAHKIHSSMASLLSRLSANKAMLEEAIAAACETVERSQRCRNSPTEFQWCRPVLNAHSDARTEPDLKHAR
jgi:hypothetical protein